MDKLTPRNQIQPIKHTRQPQQVKLILEKTVHLSTKFLKIILAHLIIPKNINTLIHGHKPLYLIAQKCIEQLRVFRVSALSHFPNRLQILECKNSEIAMPFKNLLKEFLVQFWIDVFDDPGGDHLVVNLKYGIEEQLLDGVVL